MNYLSPVLNAFVSAYNWFFGFLESLGLYSYFAGVFIVMLICRFFLKPLLGNGINVAGSDSAMASKLESRIKADRDARHQAAVNYREPSPPKNDYWD